MSATTTLDGGHRTAAAPPAFWHGPPSPPKGAFALGPVAFALALVLAAAYLAAFVWQLGSTDYNYIGVLWVAPVLLAISYPLLRWATRGQPDLWMRRLIVVGFFAKLFMAFANYFVLFYVYSGKADAAGYHQFGTLLYQHWRRRNFDLAPIAGIAGDSGLRFARIATGVVYMATGPSKLAGFLVFSWFAFWGLFLFLRAFQLAFPSGSHRRYGTLVLLFPSLIFWSSGIGKEAWMVFMLGLLAYGAARLYRHLGGGLVLIGLGLLGTSIVRPHVSLLAILAVGTGYLVRRSAANSKLGPLTKALGMGVLLVLGAYSAYKFKSQYHVAGLNAGSIKSTLNLAAKDSSTGQATFNGSVTPLSVAFLLFRPYPWEATSLTSAISAVEGFALLVLAVAGRRRLLTALRLVTRDGYVAFCVAYTAAFCVAFSTISNFGTLARERTQVIPIVLVLLCLPPAVARRKRPRLPAWYRSVPA